MFSTYLSWLFYPKTALVDEEDATLYGKESLSVDESCEVEVDEPSSDSPQLPVEDADDTIQSKSDQGEFNLFFLSFSLGKFCRRCDTVNTRRMNLTLLKSSKRGCCSLGYLLVIQA